MSRSGSVAASASCRCNFAIAFGQRVEFAFQSAELLRTAGLRVLRLASAFPELPAEPGRSRRAAAARSAGGQVFLDTARQVRDVAVAEQGHGPRPQDALDQVPVVRARDPAPRQPSSRSSSCCRVSMSRSLVGSSSSSTLGSAISSRTSCSRRRSPPERSPTGVHCRVRRKPSSLASWEADNSVLAETTRPADLLDGLHTRRSGSNTVVELLAQSAPSATVLPSDALALYSGVTVSAQQLTATSCRTR